LAGKILRVDPETGEGPADNPFFDGNPVSNRSRVFAYGFRNPFRMVQNRATDEIYVGDVGLLAWEELNRLRPGANYGWPCYEGGSEGNERLQSYSWHRECVRLYGLADNAVEAPRVAYGRPSAGAAIVLGAFYESPGGGKLNGSLVFGDFMAGWIRAWSPAGEVVELIMADERPLATGPVHITADPAGQLYVVYLDAVKRIVVTDDH
jgi:glucose/arabinose dehydrogenase